MKRVDHSLEEKYVSEDQEFSMDITRNKIKQTRLLMIKAGYIQEISASYYLMDQSKLLIERKIYSSFHRGSILLLRKLKISTLKLREFRRYSFTEIPYKHIVSVFWFLKGRLLKRLPKPRAF